MVDSSLSDHIGRIGEDHFDLIANKAKLLIGQIIPDRLGRDRVIEFGLEKPTSQSYDKRPPPIGCSVQIKTIMRSKDRVSLSLSVAERLAGDTRPTFVCIVRLDDDDELFDLHLVHILDENLGKVLRRLRKEYSKGTIDLNKKKISFSTSAGRKIEPFPVALTEALTEMIGPDMEAYATRKSAQRRTVGFDEESWLTADVAFDVDSEEELIDGMLGLKALKFSKFDLFEERFEIKLPFEHSAMRQFHEGHFEVVPEPIDNAILRFEALESGEQAELNCEIISPGLPGIPLEKIKLLARTELFDAVIGFGTFKITGNKLLTETEKLPARTWVIFLRSWQIMSQLEFKVELLSKEQRSLFRGDAQFLNGTGQLLNAEIATLERLAALREEAGAGDTPIDFPSVIEAHESIRLVHAYFFAPSDVGDCTFQFHGDLPIKKNQLPVLFVSALIVGSERYAYGLRFEMDVVSSDDKHSFKSSEMRALQIAKLDDETTSLRSFANRLGKISGVELRVVQDFEKLEE